MDVKDTNKKATKADWFRNGVRNDLNSLIVKNTKQNELVESLIKKIDLLSDEVAKLRSEPRVI